MRIFADATVVLRISGSAAFAQDADGVERNPQSLTIDYWVKSLDIVLEPGLLNALYRLHFATGCNGLM